MGFVCLLYFWNVLYTCIRVYFANATATPVNKLIRIDVAIADVCETMISMQLCHFNTDSIYH